MSPATRIGLALGVALAPLALLTGVFAVLYLKREDQRLELLNLQKAQSPIVVHTVTRRVERGEVLSSELLTTMEMPASFVVPCVLAEVPLEGRTATEPLIPNECVRPERLGPAGAQGLQVLVAAGQRAESFNLPSDATVSGFLVPGDRVDVVVTLPAEGDHFAETQTLVQGAVVLHAGTVAIPSERGGEPVIRPQVTLALFPGDAEKVTATLEHGRPRLTLRSSLDFEYAAERPPIHTSDLLGTARDRLTVTEYRERVGPEELQHMIRIFQGPEEKREVAIDPRLIRPIPTPRPAGSVTQ